jgi:hypothetical protein
MKRTCSLLILLIIGCSSSFAQRFHVGVFGGLAAYNGDLTEGIFPKKVTNGAIGITGNYELTTSSCAPVLLFQGLAEQTGSVKTLHALPET